MKKKTKAKCKMVCHMIPAKIDSGKKTQREHIKGSLNGELTENDFSFVFALYLSFQNGLLLTTNACLIR